VEARIDLHLHTTMSDGKYEPSYVVEKAIEAGLSVISLTDHDTIQGSLAGLEAAGDRIKVILGVEFSSFYNGEEIHILGYFPRGVGGEIQRILENLQEERVSRMKLCLLNLRKKGFRVGYEDVLKFVGGRSVSRSHIARALVEQGYASSIYEAFTRFLTAEAGLIPPPTLTPHRLFKILSSSDAISVWAHPEPAQFDRYIKEFAEAGLCGVEICMKRRTQFALYYEKTALDMGLLLTFGSDWHGFTEEETFGVSVPQEKIEPFLRLF